MNKRQLGPIIGATLLHNDIDSVINSYQKTLNFTLVSRSTISEEHAKLWQTPHLAGNAMAVLATANGDGLLRVLEDPNALPAKPLKSYGWMAFETNVANVDLIRKKFTDDTYTIIGEPAYLQVSDAIKAMQVIGSAGEVGYFTQILREVPPFELPMTTAETGNIFIIILCTPNRSESLDFYQALNNATPGLLFDTKVTVLNNAWGYDIEHKFPVATLQLDGNCLFEIDQVANAQKTPKNTLPSGIAMITCQVKNINEIAKLLKVDIHRIQDEYYGEKSVIFTQGPAGEYIELIG